MIRDIQGIIKSITLGECIKWDSIFWDGLSLIGATREILGNPYKLGQYRIKQK